MLLLPAVPVPVGGVQLSLNAAVLDLFSGSSLLSPPNLLLLTLSPALLHCLPLLSVTSRGGGTKRSPQSVSALREERGGVELRLRVARVPTLGHGEIPQRPLLVAGCGAGSLLLGRDVGDGGGLPWTETVIIADAAAAWGDGYCGDRGLGGDGCHRADQRGRQGLQFDLTSVSQLRKQQESCQKFGADKMTTGELKRLIWRWDGLNVIGAGKLEINGGVCCCYRSYLVMNRWMDKRIK